jgi:hypothetical protein
MYQRWRVVDAVTHHSNHLSLLLTLAPDPGFVLRHHFGHHVVDANLLTNGSGRGEIVTGHHGDAPALAPQGLA